MLTIGVKPKNSSDLDVGRRPELKSDELFCFTPMVHEILRCEHFFTAEKVLHLFGALPRAARRSESGASCGACGGGSSTSGCTAVHRSRRGIHRRICQPLHGCRATTAQGHRHPHPCDGCRALSTRLCHVDCLVGLLAAPFSRPDERGGLSAATALSMFRTLWR